MKLIKTNPGASPRQRIFSPQRPLDPLVFVKQFSGLVEVFGPDGNLLAALLHLKEMFQPEFLLLGDLCFQSLEASERQRAMKHSCFGGVVNGFIRLKMRRITSQ